MANTVTPGAAFGFNNPAFCDWKLKIKISNDMANSGSHNLRPRKRQKLGAPSGEGDGITLLVSALTLGKHSEFFR